MNSYRPYLKNPDDYNAAFPDYLNESKYANSPIWRPSNSQAQHYVSNELYKVRALKARLSIMLRELV